MINRFSPMERANSGKSQYTTLTLMLKLFFILVYKKATERAYSQWLGLC